MTGWALRQLNGECKMDPIEKLLELYKQTQAPSERSVLLETVRISSPDGFSRLEERILKEQVRGMTMEELVHVIAAHRDLSLEQAEELLRDTIFQNLLDRSKLSPVGSAFGTGKSASSPVATQAAPQSAELGKSDGRRVQVVILKDPNQGEEMLSAVGEISETNQNRPSPVPAKPVTPLPQLTPRGIGG